MLFSTDHALFNGSTDWPLIPISMTDRVNNKIPNGSTRLPWPQFVELFEKASHDPYTHKEAAPLWSPTIFLSNHRCHENATDSGVLVLDSDGVATIEQILTIANDLGIECIVHSSGRNGAVIPKWRIIVPLSSLIDRHAYYTATHALFRVLSTMLAPAWTKPAIGCDLSKLHSGDILYVCGTYDTAVGDDKIPFRPINVFHRVNGDIWSADDWIELADTINPIIVETAPLRATESTTSQPGFLDAAGWDVEVQCADKLALYRGLGSGRHGALYSLACSIANSAYWYRHDLSAADLADILDREQRHNPPASRYDARGLHNAACRAIDGAPAFVGTQRPLPAPPVQVDWQYPLHPDIGLSWWQRETEAPVDPQDGKDDASVAGSIPFSDAAGPEGAGMSDADGAADDRAYRKGRLRPFSDFLNRPPIEYYDDDKRFPIVPHGYIVAVLGERESHKTGYVTVTSFEMMGKGYRVCYVPCEGEDFFGQNRIPAYCADLGMNVADLDGRFQYYANGIDLTSDDTVQQFIDDNSEFHPNFVCIDTLGQATYGIDQNGKEMGDILSKMGRVQKIADAFPGCIIMLLCHPPEGRKDRISGSNTQSNNIPETILVEYNRQKDPTLVTATVIRYKDGKVGTKLFFSVDPNTVPVLRRIDDPMTNEKPLGVVQPTNPDLAFSLTIRTRLADSDIGEAERGLNNRELAELLVHADTTDRHEAVERMVQKLKNIQKRHIRREDSPNSDYPERVKFYDDLCGRILTSKTGAASGWRWWDKRLRETIAHRDQFREEHADFLNTLH